MTVSISNNAQRNEINGKKLLFDKGDLFLNVHLNDMYKAANNYVKLQANRCKSREFYTCYNTMASFNNLTEYSYLCESHEDTSNVKISAQDV
jgi:hypothetical protein